jgi:Mlc titration factor MtfA (ptsG expression regulator)
MEPVLLVLAAAALIAVAYIALSRLLLRIRWHRPLVFRAEPIPETWHAIIYRNVPLTRKLPPDQLTRLLRLTQLFLHDKHIEGCGGLEVTEEIRVTVAAQACVLLLGIDAGCYPGLRTVLLYPTPYRKTETVAHSGGWKEEGVQWNAGEAWSRGIVVLAWNHALHGARNAFDGRNVILHEFAHQLDFLDGAADGVAPIAEGHAIRVWADVLERHLGLLRKALKKRRKTVMREYGATNKAEFFAVATEAFFEKPRQLHKRRPDLYDALQRVYGMDPKQPQMMAPTDDRL